MRVPAFLLLLALGACALTPVRGAEDPLRYDPAEVAAAERLAIFIPGALSSVDVFAATEGWEAEGYGRALYRYPGLDGMPVDHHVSPAAAAAHVAAFANRYPGKPVALVGYSTGGPIALLAAPQISGGREVRVAALSTAVENGGGLDTALRGVRDIARAVVATGSVRKEDLWKRFWSGLLYGPDAFDDPAIRDRLEEKIREGEEIYVKLDAEMALAHTLALPLWHLPEDLDLGGIPVAFFVGMKDPVFAPSQTLRFAGKLDTDVTIYGYREDGHLLFFTRPDVFDHVRAYLEGRPVPVSD